MTLLLLPVLAAVGAMPTLMLISAADFYFLRGTHFLERIVCALV
jgi:hypothetical protein